MLATRYLALAASRPRAARMASDALGMLPALVLLLRPGRGGRKESLPYGPFLAAGGVVGLFFGEALLDAWLG